MQIAIRAATKHDCDALNQIIGHVDGLHREHLPHIFQEFYQANRKRDQALGGAGIGLALTKRLVEMHGGTITVESQPGQGASFALTLPMHSMPEPEADARSREPHGGDRDQGKGLSVLLVTDDPSAAALAEAACAALQHRLTRARSCDEALKRVSSEPPDAIVFDLLGGEEAALETVAQIRSDSRLAHVACVLVTSDGSGDMAARARASGFDACLVRPIPPSVALNEIVRLVAQRASERNMEL